MALPKKGTGSGTKAYISTDGSEFTQFLSVSKVSPPDYSRGTVDLTDNASYDDNNQMKEFGVGFVEAGELKIEGWHRTDDTGITVAETAFFDGTPVQIKLVSPPWMGKPWYSRASSPGFRPSDPWSRKTAYPIPSP